MNWRKILKYTPSAPAFVEFSPFKSAKNPRKEPSFIDNNRFIIASDHYMARLSERGMPTQPRYLNEFLNKVFEKEGSIPTDVAVWSYGSKERPVHSGRVIIIYSFNTPGNKIRAQSSGFKAPSGKNTLLLETIYQGGNPPRAEYVELWD